MQAALIGHLNAVQRALAEVSELVHEAGIAGHYNEAQVEKLKAKIVNAAKTVDEELEDAFTKLESYFEKPGKSAVSGGEVRPPAPPAAAAVEPEPPGPPAPEPSASPEPPPVDPEPPPTSEPSSS